MKMHYDRQKGEAVEKHRLKYNAKHERFYKGQRVRLQKGDTFHPNANELKSFGDKFEVVVEKPDATFDDEEPKTEPKKPESKPTPTPPSDSGNPGGSDEPPADPTDSDDPAPKTDGAPPVALDRALFASDPAFAAWEEAGKPAMTVEKTGHGGSTWSKSDVEKQIAK